jgi:hypothetical protein
MAPPDDFTLRAERELRESLDVATLRRRVADLEAALAWYATAAHYFYKRTLNAEGETVSRDDPEVMYDMGGRAIAALRSPSVAEGGGRRGEGGGV